MKDSLNGGYKYYPYRHIVKRDLYWLIDGMVDERKTAWRDDLRRGDADSIKKEIAAAASEKETLLGDVKFFESKDEDLEDIYRRWATDPELLREVLAYGKNGEKFERLLREAGYDMLRIAISVDKTIREYLVADGLLGLKWDETLDYIKPLVLKEDWE